jgi:hypothetical protein
VLHDRVKTNVVTFSSTLNFLDDDDDDDDDGFFCFFIGNFCAPFKQNPFPDCDIEM